MLKIWMAMVKIITSILKPEFNLKFDDYYSISRGVPCTDLQLATETICYKEQIMIAGMSTSEDCYLEKKWKSQNTCDKQNLKIVYNM